MNIYSKCSVFALSLLDTRLLNATPKKAVDLVKNLVNSIGLISGPTTTAKTELIPRMVKPFLCVLLTLDYNGGAGILVYIPNNFAADKIAELIHSSAKNNHLTKDAIILRMYRVGTEEVIVDIRPEANEDQMSDNSFLIADQPILSIAILVLVAYTSSQIRCFGVRNKRYIRHNMSLGI